MGIARAIALFLGCCTVGSAGAASFQITEFLAVNNQSITDEDGAKPDWIEIHNPGTETAFLDGWFLTDDAFNLTKWRFPTGVEMQPNSYLIVFASDKNRTNAFRPLHVNFRLSSDGEYLALVDPNTNVVSEFAPFYPEQFTDISYGRDAADPSVTGYLPRPTPGARNLTTGPGFAPEVTFSRASGTFPLSKPFLLTLSTYDIDATIQYAFGTNVPSLLYTNPILISNSTIVRARCIQAGLLPGPVDSRSYLALSNDVLNFSSDLPLMIVHNFGQGDVSEVNQYVAVHIFEPGSDRSSLTNAATQTERGRFHVRGVTSSQWPKRGFFLEIQDELGADKESELLGLPEESDWVLYAPYVWDPAMIHNPLAYAIMRDFGRYAARTRYVELFLRDNSGAPGPVTAADYHGVYVLTEKIKRDNNRVAIDSLEAQQLYEPEITGGYLFSRDPTRTGPDVALRFGNYDFWWLSPRGIEMTNPVRRPQVQYISNYLASLSSVLASPQWTNPVIGYLSLIDRPAWIDHHVHQVLTLGDDALGASSYFHKPRLGKLAFGPPWDFDRSQGIDFSFNPHKWATSSYFNPSYLPWWSQLFRDPDFWQKWIDRYQELRQGALSTNSIFAHIDDFANQLREAHVRDASRWGAHVRTGILSNLGFSFNFGPAGSFANEIAFQKFWYTNRLYFLDSNLLGRPVISHMGGMVGPGTTVTVSPATKPGTVLFYTLDGADPRLSGGAINPAALSNVAPVTITVLSNICIAARSYNPDHSNLTSVSGTAPPLSSRWSGINHASLYWDIPPLRISEIMYHPDGVDEGFEYLKVLNVGTEPLNLQRFRITGGIEFEFPSVQLPAGASAVLVANETLFRERYGESNLVVGTYSGRLDNAGDRLRLIGPCEEPILDFRYEDDWYPMTDGFGLSLVVVDGNAPLTNWNSKAQWRSSGWLHSSPVVVNELLSHSEIPPPYDWVELHNASDAPADVSYWFLTDDRRTPRKYQIPPETVIPPRGFVVFDEWNFNFENFTGVPFSFSSLGDEVFIFSGDVDGNLTGYSHGFNFGTQEDGVTFGRHVASGEERFVRQSAATLGAPNAGSAVGPIVISEIMYRPPDLWRGTDAVDNRADEFIELQNIAAFAVTLAHPDFPLNGWRIDDAVGYEFPPGTSLPPGGLLVVVGFDAADAALTAAFRARYAVPSTVPIFGPYVGKLDNSSERVSLQKPDTPRPDGPPDFGLVPYPVVEEVDYRDSQPWPEWADGFGPSLHRLFPGGYADDPTNWVAAAPTPGRAYVTGPGPVIINQPVNTTLVEYTTGSLRVDASGAERVIYQWRLNGLIIPGATSATLTLTNVQTSQAGIYDVIVADAANSVWSAQAQLTVLDSVEFVRHPVSQAIGAGADATFTVIAAGDPPIAYQWKFNGTNIAGAHATNLTVNNITNTHEGWYSVVASNEISARESLPAFLTVLLAPRLIVPVPPLRITATTNQSLTFGAQTLGTLPTHYRWRRISPSGTPFTISNVLENSRTHFATFSLAGLSNGTWVYALSLSNVVYPSLSIAWTNALVTIVADSDRDGLPDDYESLHGLLPHDPSDAGTDTDADGLSNLEEFLAGTNPNDIASLLRIQGIAVLPPPIIRFDAVSNRTYSLEYSDDSAGDFWHKLTDVLPHGTSRIEVIHDPAPAAPRFYRLRTPRRP